MLIAFLMMAEVSPAVAHASPAPAPAPPTIAQALQAALDPCPPRASPDEITVCGRRGAEKMRGRFRLPYEDRGFDPEGPLDSVSRERHRLIDADGSAPDLSMGSCSAVGASGATGCMIKGWREKDEQYGRY